MRVGNRIWNQPNRIHLIYGALTAAGLVVYFLIMYLAGLIHVLELRRLNFFIALAAVYFAMKQYKRTHNGRLDYFNALVTGAATAAVGALLFGAFVLLYLHLDQNLMNAIIKEEPLGLYMNPYISAFFVFLEGLFAGFGIAYLLSNFLATDTPSLDRASDRKISERVVPGKSKAATI